MAALCDAGGKMNAPVRPVTSVPSNIARPNQELEEWIADRDSLRGRELTCGPSDSVRLPDAGLMS
jgi:hypothetical protein